MHIRSSSFLVVIVWCQALIPNQVSAGQLQGRIVNMSTDPPLPVPSARVRIEAIKEEDTTRSHGEFSIRLPDSLRPGEQVEITLDAVAHGKKLLLFQPLDGRILIPAQLDKQIIRLGVLPSGSPRFKSDETI